MAVVRNLMIRIGADYSPAKKAMDGATRELTKFRKDTERTTRSVSGQKGLGGISKSYKDLGRELTASISRLRGARGIGGVTAELKNLIPVAGRSAKSLVGVGETAATLGSRLGTAGIAVSAFTAIIGAMTVGVAAASQEAIRFEATIGRLNYQLGAGSRGFMDWARAQGLAKESAAEMGATYATLLSSFIHDSDELQRQTMAIAQTTRVVASRTGRSIEDVLERMRSGLLGNTEAIEDLGIFVNISMIESTNAFKKFANGKSWNQLDFRVQQQIRLAAILEQAYARYGDQLQKNTMTKQDLLIEQFKNIKLHLSQAFQPVYDSVLPKITSLAEGVANLTEKLARFMYSLRGWDYDEMTRGATDNADAVNREGEAFDDLADSAKKARNELASFDELNLIGDTGAGAGGGGTGGTGTGGTGVPSLPAIPQEPIKIGFEWDIPDPPPIVIPPPQPPDAGMGAVATAVTSTVSRMVEEVRGQSARMWQDVYGDTLTWSPVVQGAVAAMMAGIALTTGQHTDVVQLDWRGMLQGMVGDLSAYTPGISSGWDSLMAKIGSIKSPLADVRVDWKSTLGYMQQQLNAYRPYLEWGLHLIAVAVRKPISPLADLKDAWKSTLSDMQTSLNTAVGNIAAKLGSLVAEIQRARAEAAKPIATPALQPAAAPATTPAQSGVAVDGGAGRNTVLQREVSKETYISELMRAFGQIFSGEQLSKVYELLRAEAAKPENQTGLQLYMSLVGGGVASGLLAKFGAQAITKAKSVWDALRGTGSLVPSFSTGGAVFGPTLAMIGDNPGARHDPEIAAPQSYIEEAVMSGNADMLRALERIEQAVRDLRYIQAVIAESDVGRAATNYIRSESRRGRNPLMGV